MLTFLLATKDDAKLITEIKTAAYDDENKRFGPDKDISAFWGPQWYANLDENERLINESAVYKIILEDKVIGTFTINKEGNESVHLDDFCIDPQFQNKGYGYESLMKMVNLYPDKKRWELRTPYYSIRNQHLYEKFGYIKIGVSETGFAYIYEKKL